MIESDTIKLLRECDAGIKMGVSSIEDVRPQVRSDSLERILTESVENHRRLGREIEEMLHRFEDDGKNPNPMAKGMSKVKTNFKMAMNHTDNTVADLMTDGCNMGIKTLSRYLNEYAAADEKSKDIAKKLISMEAQLAIDLRQFL